MTANEHLERIARGLEVLTAYAPSAPSLRIALESLTAIRATIAQMERQRVSEALVLVDLCRWRDKEIADLSAERDLLAKNSALIGAIRRILDGEAAEKVIGDSVSGSIIDVFRERIATLEGALRNLIDTAKSYRSDILGLHTESLPTQPYFELRHIPTRVDRDRVIDEADAALSAVPVAQPPPENDAEPNGARTQEVGL